jgi:uncharacterized membrane protein
MKIVKLIFIALASFLVKHFVQATIEWTDIIPVRPKSYIWDNFAISKGYFGFQLVYVFWIFLIAVIIIYFLLKELSFSAYKTKILYFLCPFFIFLCALIAHQFEFPMKELDLPKREVFNYNLISDFIVYSVTSIFMLKSLMFILNSKE